jgi:hypothetical protein
MARKGCAIGSRPLAGIVLGTSLRLHIAWVAEEGHNNKEIRS